MLAYVFWMSWGISIFVLSGDRGLNMHFVFLAQLCFQEVREAPNVSLLRT